MIPETGELDWDRPRPCLNDHRTRLLAIGAASNALGTINDVARAVAMAREAEAMSFVDAVHFAPHRARSTSRNGAATFWPARPTSSMGRIVGVLFARRERLEALDVPKLEPAPETAPERLETGTQNHEGIVGAAAAVDYLASLARPDEVTTGRATAANATAGRVRMRYTSEGLLLRNSYGMGSSEIEGVKLFGPPPASPRTPTLAFTVKGQTGGAGQPAAGRSRNLRLSRRLSTRQRSPGGWAWPTRGSSGSAAPATQRVMRSAGSSRRCAAIAAGDE